MKIRCAWCNKDMGEKDGNGTEGISHGVCNECLTRLESGIKDGRSKEKSKSRSPAGTLRA